MNVTQNGLNSVEANWVHGVHGNINYQRVGTNIIQNETISFSDITTQLYGLLEGETYSIYIEEHDVYNDYYSTVKAAAIIFIGMYN